jgi:predicted nucleotidyltransferase
LLEEIRTLLRSFCEKHRIRRLEVFGSAARGQSLDESTPVSTGDLLEIAGEAEELVGVTVDFVLRHSLGQSPNPFAREHILASAVCVY